MIFYLGAPYRSNSNAKPKRIQKREEVSRPVIQSEEKLGRKNRNDVQITNLESMCQMMTSVLM